MGVAPAAVLTLVTISAAGVLPALALAGRRLVTVVLCPLAGSAVAGLAASLFVAVGWSFIGWFFALAAAGAAAVLLVWVRRPGLRPGLPPAGDASPEPRGDRLGSLVTVAAVFGVVAATAFCLRSLATPSIGFDARALWLLRSGWFLQSHHQLLLDLRTRDILLVQTPYPPLVSAAGAVSWWIDGRQSMRLGVVVVALLDSCALVAACLAVLEAGRVVRGRLVGAVDRHVGGAARAGARAPGGEIGWVASLTSLPLLGAAALSVLLVFIAFGITEPFITNGYADPIWSLAALGALVYGLQLPASPGNAGVAAVLLAVAGMGKNEGAAAAVVIVLLVAARLVAAQPTAERRASWWKPVAGAAAVLAAVGVWPLLMHAIHARGVTQTFSPASRWAYRARVTYDGMAPYLHVVLLAVPVALVGGLALRRVRRRGGLANDAWAWAGISGGLFTVVATLVTGTVAIVPWVQGSAHRTTEFPALVAWWILAVWAVVGLSAPAAARLDDPSPGRGAPAAGEEEEEADGGRDELERLVAR